MTDLIKIQVAISVVNCANCGIPFGLPDYFEAKLRETGNDFYCPNGHSLVFDSEFNKLKKELTQAKRDTDLYKQWYSAEQDDHERTRRQLSTTKGQLTKTKKRIANGVCPCCHRTFADLARHMTGKHPEFAQESDSESRSEPSE